MRSVLTILLCMIPFTASAEWTQYKVMENGDEHYFDPTQVETEGNIVRVLSRVRYRTSVMGAKSYESEIKLNCLERTQSSVRSTFFNDENWKTPAMATNTREQPPVGIKAGSAVDSLAEILCE